MASLVSNIVFSYYKSRALMADELGMSTRTLKTKIKQLGIELIPYQPINAEDQVKIYLCFIPRKDLKGTDYKSYL